MSRENDPGPGFEEFIEKFSQLGEEAKQYGISYIVLLTGYDPISETNQCFHVYDGNLYELIGAGKVVLNGYEQNFVTRDT